MRFILGILIGAAIGAVIGVTVAPQSGKETREALATRMRQTGDEAHEVAPTA